MTALLQKKLFPVIHCEDPYEQQGISHALKNTEIALKNGADGIFLIGHRINYMDLAYIYRSVRNEFHDTWIGINFLDLFSSDHRKVEAVASACTGINALWIDSLPNRRLTFDSNIQVFGGVAFKYIDPNPEDENLLNQCKSAIAYVDVATTSGDKTGSPPSLQKLKTIHRYLEGKTPLALASGVTEDNVLEMKPYIDYFFVASSISRKDTLCGVYGDYLIPQKVQTLADKIHS